MHASHTTLTKQGPRAGSLYEHTAGTGRHRDCWQPQKLKIVTEVCPESATAVPQGLPEVISVVTFKLSFCQGENGGKGILGQSSESP